MASSRYYALPQAARIEYNALDEQHEDLLGQLNTCLDQIGQNEGRIAVEQCFDPLSDKMFNHFLHEEEVMAKLRYHGLDWHIEHHRESMARLKALRGQCSEKGYVDIDDINECFSQVIDDVLRADLKFKTYLHARGIL